VTVVDASVVAAMILREEGWERLLKHLKGATTLNQAFKEASNAIWKAFRRGHLSRDEAVRAFDLLKSVMEALDVRSEAEYLDDAFGISLETGLTVYDSLYLALASSERKQLLTLDEDQRRAAEKLNVPVMSI